MLSLSYLFESDNSNIKLLPFDEIYFTTLPDFDKIKYDPKGFYQIISYNNKKAGVVGVIPSKFGHAFFQIVIDPKFRGKGILKSAAELISDKANITHLDATINKSNIISIKAHLKAGFKPLDEHREKILRDQGFLKSDDIRLTFFRN